MADMVSLMHLDRSVTSIEKHAKMTRVVIPATTVPSHHLTISPSPVSHRSGRQFATTPHVPGWPLSVTRGHGQLSAKFQSGKGFNAGLPKAQRSEILEVCGLL